MSKEGVTVAIPNWNHELLLSRGIASALAAVRALREEGGDGEVLIIDDASRDGSLPLLRQLETQYYGAGLRVLALARNAGLAHARNLALTHRRYRHIVFLDADNELIPKNTPCFWRAAQETSAAACYGNLLVRTITSQRAFFVYSNEPFQDRIFQNNYVDALAMFDGDQLADGGGYLPNASPIEDHEQWLHLATNGRGVVFVPAVFGYYYLLPESMITDAGKAQAATSMVRRMYDQFEARAHLPMKTRHLRYHPAIGYLGTNWQ
ncbi:hypothetical protein AYO40_02035 [Planctomycetaceae bacterium SCGC AG-212-D15]|nr:hypothetical protein AYO40_02035 [Planctomycetaceae bacterium SCGC AG-212-D15]